jgi:DegV family protein with EDD domain
LRQALLAGSHTLMECQSELNAINVFPVPDGDTGTNLAATAASIVAGLSRVHSNEVAEVARAAAESALMGARGNSGVILAQFFQGLHEKVQGKAVLNTREFGEAVYHAALQSRQALAEPREGTILTVLREWAAWIRSHSAGIRDFSELLRHSVGVARQSLAETPKRLEILRKSGVVDAGAKGFVHLLEGMVQYLETGKVRSAVATHHLVERLRHFHFGRNEGTIRFRYCTQCLVEGQGLNKDKVRSELSRLGDSLIVIGGAQRLRVHIHTNEPEEVFALLHRFGQVTDRKAEDMLSQHLRATEPAHPQGIGLVTDSTCDLPKEFLRKHGIEVVPLTLNIDGRSYRDRQELSPEQFYRMLPRVRTHPTTSQPAPGDFLAVYQRVGRTREAVISIHLSSALSGTYQNAVQAARTLEGTEIAVLDSKTASIALGLIVQEAALAIEQGLTVQEVLARIRRAIENQRIFVVLPTLTYAVRSGRVSRPKGIIGNLLGLKPILTLTQDGRAVEVARGLSEKHAMQKTLKMVERFLHEGNFTSARFGVAHANVPEKAEWYVEQLRQRFAARDVPVVNASPVLGNHTGPGTVAVAVLGLDE